MQRCSTCELQAEYSYKDQLFCEPCALEVRDQVFDLKLDLFVDENDVWDAIQRTLQPI